MKMRIDSVYFILFFVKTKNHVTMFGACVPVLAQNRRRTADPWRFPFCACVQCCCLQILNEAEMEEKKRSEEERARETCGAWWP